MRSVLDYNVNMKIAKTVLKSKLFLVVDQLIVEAKNVQLNNK